jgi:hypothetical protein
MWCKVKFIHLKIKILSVLRAFFYTFICLSGKYLTIIHVKSRI